MDKFDSIVADILSQVAKLQEINRSLCEENTSLSKKNDSLLKEITSLKEQLGMPIQNKSNDLSLDVVFENFNLPNDKSGIKLQTLSCLKRSYFHFKTLEDFRNTTVDELLNIPKFGPTGCAILIVLLEHYNIHLKPKNLECITSATTRNQVKKIYKELVPQYKAKLSFTD